MTGDSAPWFSVSRLTETVWRIEEAGLVSEYLIAGDDRALLIDTGFGIGDIARTVAGLTQLPLIIVNTHGHIDHTNGNDQFGAMVHIREADVPLLARSYETSEKRTMLDRFPKDMLPQGFQEQRWVHASCPRYQAFGSLEDFDIGGRVIDVIPTPGHTPGSICLYDRTERLLFVGDSLLDDHTLLMLSESLPLATYLGSIEKLAALADGVDHVLPAHGAAPLKPEVLCQMAEGVRKVIDGELEGSPETTALGTGRVISFGSCGIKYNDRKLK